MQILDLRQMQLGTSKLLFWGHLSKEGAFAGLFGYLNSHS